MKTKLLCTVSALLASGLAILGSYACGARGETLGIIAVVTVVVSCSTAFAAASLAFRVAKKKSGIG